MLYTIADQLHQDYYTVSRKWTCREVAEAMALLRGKARIEDWEETRRSAEDQRAAEEKQTAAMFAWQ